MTYIYPAIFSEDENGAMNVNFPDFEACFTYGKNLADALSMAEDVLSLTLFSMEKSDTAPPAASDIRELQTKSREFSTLIKCDTDDYAEYFALKENLSKKNI
ncbi:MAG: type II toxin-antitoxin system HicB family antitoxin [Ruminococcus sp.]|jgi:predicted RNase H-like HicB family nuclease|nr:type II toxin-antitoxin system HicB family antitoxin [Ruminococcus sp.]